MKELRFIVYVIICLALLFNNISAFADADNGVLTLEDAKELALKNNVQFNLQQSYIQKASENYENVYEKNSKADKTNYNSIADRAAAEVSRKIAIENAASNVRKAIFNRNDLKRSSNYNVTTAYYNVIKSMYSLEDQERNMQFKMKALDTAAIKYNLGIITKNTLSQAEESLESERTSYNKAFSELQNNMAALSKLIDKNLDVFNDKLDMTVTLPDVKGLDLNKIKEDNMKNSSGFYSVKEQYDIAEYERQLTEEKYDYYYNRLPNRTSTIMEKLDDMLSDAKRNFEDVKHSYSEKEKELDVSLNNQYTSINNLYDTYESQKKKIEDAELSIEQDRIKFQMGLITKSALEQSEASLEDLKNQLNTTIINLNTQYASITQYSLE